MFLPVGHMLKQDVVLNVHAPQCKTATPHAIYIINAFYSDHDLVRSALALIALFPIM